MLKSKVSLKNKVIKNLFINLDKNKFNEYDLDKVHSALIEEELYYLQMRCPISKINQDYISNIKDHIGLIDLNIEINEASKKE